MAACTAVGTGKPCHSRPPRWARLRRRLRTDELRLREAGFIYTDCAPAPEDTFSAAVTSAQAEAWRQAGAAARTGSVRELSSASPSCWLSKPNMSAPAPGGALPQQAPRPQQAGRVPAPHQRPPPRPRSARRRVGRVAARGRRGMWVRAVGVWCDSRACSAGLQEVRFDMCTDTYTLTYYACIWVRILQLVEHAHGKISLGRWGRSPPYSPVAAKRLSDAKRRR